MVWLERVGSTNDYLAALPNAGSPRVVLSWNQVEGRGRAGRTWLSPEGASLALSIDLGPVVPYPLTDSWLGAVPLVAGACLADAVGPELTATPAVKWPNDVLLGRQKLAGILGEVPQPGRVILGIGLNVWAAPSATGALVATCLADYGLSNQEALSRVLQRFVTDFLTRMDNGREGLQGSDWEFVRHHLDTLGRVVRVLLPDGSSLRGLANDIDEAGRLVVTTSTGSVVVSAGDIEHLRLV